MYLHAKAHRRCGQQSTNPGKRYYDRSPAARLEEHSDSSPDKRDQNEAEHADSSTEKLLDEYYQFATSVLDRSENTVDRTPATSDDFLSMPIDHRRASPKTTSQTTSTPKVT